MLASMKPKQRKFSIGYLALALVAVLAFQIPLFGSRAANVSYSEFKALAKKGKVSNLTLDKETISGTLSTDGLETLLSKEKLEELKRLGDGPHRFVAARVEDPGLVAELEQANVKFAGHVENTWLATLLSWVLPAVVFAGVWVLLMRRFGPQQGLMAIGKSKARVYVEHKTGVTFDDVAGVDEARGELMEIVDFLKNPERYRRLGGKIPKGVLIVGAPGTGKTLLAKAVAGEAGGPVFSLSGSGFVEMVVGGGAAHVRDVKLAPGLDLSLVAAKTPGFVGADLANLVNEAALHAAREGKEVVDAVDFDEATDRMVGGLERRSRVINPKEKEIVAYHEAGHALVAESREHADRVAKISVIPRGVAALGYTQQQPTEDRYLMTRAELLDRLDVLLGGRVAEELVFGDVSTGAQDDLQRATDIARHMVARYGMSAALGLATFEPPRQALFLNVPSMAQREYSEETARRIDDEIRKLFEAAHARVRETLTAKREVLTSLAKLLIDKEVGSRLRRRPAPTR